MVARGIAGGIARRLPGAGGSGGVVLPITSINANGWSAVYPSPPTFDPSGDPETFNASRPGYSTAAATTTYTESMTFTRRLRQVYPNEGSLTTDQVVINDYLYSTDTISGVTNNSTETSPKPIANWVTLDRTVVGDTLTAEVVCFHRNARTAEQVPCVEFRVSDGTTTLNQVVSESVVSGRTNDRNSVIVYRCSIDVSSLINPATLTLNAKVYPWIGESGSVLDSADQSARREFSPRTFRRDTTLAASPVYVYVSTTGDDVNGVVSTTAATAKATPCATIGGAINRLVAVNGSVDGCEIRMMSGTHALNSTGISTTRAQSHSHLTITRDPDEILSAVTLQYGGVAFRPRLGSAGGWVTIRDITISRTSTTQPQGETASNLEIRLQDLPFDNGSVNSALIGSAVDVLLLGLSFTNLANSVLSPGTREIRLIRGCTGTSTSNVEGWLVIGNSMTLGSSLSYGSRTASQSIVAYNTFTATNASNGFMNVAAAADVTGVAIVQNVVEYTSATSGPSIRVSADSATGNTSHVVLHHNTFAGFFNNGRGNLFYDDGATARTNKLMSCKGNIHVALNTKSDVFATDGTRIGNWAYENGVGCEGEFSQFIDADSGGIGSAFAQDYAGLRADIGTSATVRNDPLFIDDKATSSGPTAGSGGGNYRLATETPCTQMVNAILRFDLDGNSRSSGVRSTAGAYQV